MSFMSFEGEYFFRMFTRTSASGKNSGIVNAGACWEIFSLRVLAGEIRVNKDKIVKKKSKIADL
jgi:hypothetical protein